MGITASYTRIQCRRVHVRFRKCSKQAIFMREWSPHSEEKISILADYLAAFARASKRAVNRVYIDSFAGETINILKTTGEQFPGSFESALAVEPPFTSMLIFEKHRGRAASLRDLASKHPGQRISVIEGNCNEQMAINLQNVPKKAPVFAFLDPDGTELEFRTIQLLADHKRGSGKPKIEMWILLSTSGLVRMLGGNRNEAERQGHPDRVARLYGAWGPWLDVWEARLTNRVSPSEARQAYLLLYMDRLIGLGYKHLLARPIKNSHSELYVMVFASDHPVGESIMRWAQEKDRVVHRNPTPSLFEFPESRPEYEDIHTGWREEFPIALSEWIEYEWQD